MIKKYKHWLMIAVCALGVPSCAHKVDYNLVESDRELFTTGLRLYDKKEYDESIEAFESLVNRFPTSTYAVEAELRIADAYFIQEKYVEASSHYEEFLTLHPKNDRVPLVLFRLARSYFEQSPSDIDRDLTNMEKARTFLIRLSVEYPDDLVTRDARPMTEEIQTKLTRKIVYVGDFYYDRKQYAAAIERYTNALEQTGISDKLRNEIKVKLEKATQKQSRLLDHAH